MTRAWWWHAVVMLAAGFGATAASFALSVTDMSLAPILLVPATGMALMWHWGLSLWPALASGDLLGQWLVHDRSPTLIVVTMAVHVGAAVAAAAWARRVDCRPHDLGSTTRFTGIVVAVSAGATAVLMPLLALVGDIDAAGSVPLTAAIVMLGITGGFMVLAALLMTWLEPPGAAIAALRQSMAASAVLVVAFVAWMGFRWGLGIAVPIALLGALAVAARWGMRWGTAATAVVMGAALSGADADMAPFGGATPGEQGVNVTLAITLFAFAGLMVAGYRESTVTGSSRMSPRMVAVTFAVLMVVAGITSLAANAVALDVDEPFVLSGLVALGAALGLGLVRLARTPDRPPSRRGLFIAAAAGALYVLNLVVYLAAVPLIGSGTATALTMTTPLAVVILTLAIYRVRPTTGMLAAVGVIVVGAVIAAWGSLGDPMGIALAVGSGVIFAASLVITQIALRSAGVVDVALVSAAAAAAVALLIGLIVEGPGAFALTPEQIGELALAALGAQMVPLLARSWALDRISANIVGAEGVLQTVVAAVLSILFIDAVVHGSEVVGLVIITVGALLATFAGSRGGHDAPGDGRGGG